MTLRNFFCILLTLCGTTLHGEEYTVTSPNGKLTINIETEQVLTWAIEHNSNTILLPSALWLETSEGDFGINMEVKKSKTENVSRSIPTPYYKKSNVKDCYNQLLLKAEGFSVEFRAYDDGGCYRFLPSKKIQTINKEVAYFNFEDDYPAFVPYVNDNRGGERWCYSFESYYDEQRLSQMFKDSLSITPLAVSLPKGRKAVVMDAGVEDYPGMYLTHGEGPTLMATFAPFPAQVEIGGYNRLNLVPTEREAFIAQEVEQCPWRVVLVSEHDGDLLNCDMAQRLAPECRIKDLSWIKPGKVAWDWWNNTNLTGVDFEAGTNTDTYKYFIDFAQQNHLEYIIIDEGWSSSESLMERNDQIDLPLLISYAHERGVGIILWSSWRNMIGVTDKTEPAKMEDVMAYYQQMGIAGFKVDFFDRDDQEVIRSAYKIADCAAKHHLLLDLHGLKPFGIQRAYPNIVNFEGVKGLENSKWEPRTAEGPLHDQPRYDVTAPFLRMLPGPMDYTPGAMDNATRDQFFGNNNHPMSQGTRVHQMAMYTIFEAPLQMLADSPTKYQREQTCTDFIARIPTTFDETIVLDAQMGEYILLARRKGNTWFVAALTNWTPRDLTIDLSLLPNIGTHAICFADGHNAHRDATDYQRTEQTVAPNDQWHIHLAPGGGWTAIVK